MSELRYTTKTRDNLAEGECAVRRIDADLPAFGTMTFCFRRKTDGKLERREIPVRLNGPPGGPEHAWSLMFVGPGRWQVSPSILCKERLPDPADPAKDVDVETWHETPLVVGVPDDGPWPGNKVWR